MAIALRGSAVIPTGGQQNPTTGYTCTIPAQVVAGDLLILTLTSRDSVGLGSIAVTDNDTGGNTWARIGNSTNYVLTVWWKRATSATASKTLTVAGCVGSCAGVLKCFSGADTGATPYADFAAETNAAGDETHAGFTPTAGASLVCAAVANYANDNAVTSLSFATLGATTATECLSTGGNDCGNIFGHALQAARAATGNLTWAQTDGTTYSAVWTIKPLAHTDIGVLTGSGATLSGTAARIATHPSSGVLAGDGKVIVGSSNRFRAHASSGVLTGPGAAVVGSSRRFVEHASSGAIPGSVTVVVSTAAHSTGATRVGRVLWVEFELPPEHGSTGVLAGQEAALAGVAAHIANHATVGVLAGAESTITGSSQRTAAGHAASGVLAAPGSVLAATAARLRAHASSGAIVTAGAGLAGTVARTRIHVTSGAIAGTAASISASSDRATPGAGHQCSGALIGATAQIAGEARWSALHACVGAVAGGGATLAASASRTRLHAVAGVLAGPAASIAAAADRATPGAAHEASGAVVAGAAIMAGTTTRVTPVAPVFGDRPPVVVAGGGGMPGARLGVNAGAVMVQTFGSGSVPAARLGVDGQPPFAALGSLRRAA